MSQSTILESPERRLGEEWDEPDEFDGEEEDLDLDEFDEDLEEDEEI